MIWSLLFIHILVDWGFHYFLPDMGIENPLNSFNVQDVDFRSGSVWVTFYLVSFTFYLVIGTFTWYLISFYR